MNHKLTSSIFTALLLTLQMSSASTIFFSYNGLGEGTDGLGNPFVFLIGGAEPGRVDFEGNPSTLHLEDITHFSFTASLPDKDAFGNPVVRIVEFGDLLHFDATSVDGAYTNFALVSETLYFVPPDPLNSTEWDNGQRFRFTVLPDLTARLEAVSADSSSTVSEGTISIVPEPSAFVLAGIGVAVLGIRRRAGVV